jgi:exosortase
MTVSVEAVAPRLHIRERAQPAVSPWQLIVLAILLAILYYHILGRLVLTWWDDPNFSHGFFVPLFSAFVVWTERKRLAAITLKPSWWGIAVIVASLVLVIIGSLGAELYLMRTSFVFLLGGMMVLFAGWAFFRALVFPWACLFLMIPIPAIIFNQLTFPLQLLASQLSTLMLSGLGVPVLREGNVIRLPAMPLEVAEACSGIRSLVSLGTLAIIFGYLSDRSVLRRVILAVAAIPIAVFANGFRITGTGLVAQYWDPAKADGFFHEFSGWIIFVVSIVLLFLVDRLLRLISRRPAEPAQ